MRIAKLSNSTIGLAVHVAPRAEPGCQPRWHVVCAAVPGIARVNIRVQRIDGSAVTLSLSSAGWHAVVGQRRDYIIGDGVAHAFSKEGYYEGSGPVPPVQEPDWVRGLSLCGSLPSPDGRHSRGSRRVR